ncbi:MAG: hypothetical protein EHM71_03375 [Zetaproteobacteria bacterium]|nr:MAG: hypothetical protein EHM71_03375 [Zetaproteobacteria bacterium]
MSGLTTDEIVQIGLRVAGMTELPLDSGVHVPGHGIRRLLFAMDVNVGLLHMAKQSGFDAVLGHHPVGVLYDRGEVYRQHLDLLELHGVPRAAAQAAVGDFLDRAVRRMQNARFRMLPYESPNQTVLEVDAARFLKLPLLNIHNPCDALGRRILQDRIDAAAAAKPRWTVADVLALVASLPEAAYARRVYGISPLLGTGDLRAPAGKTVFVHGALSAPGAPIVRCYWDHGVDTVVMLHGDFDTLEAIRKEAKGKHLILTGHYLGDSLGITPLIRALRAAGLELTCMGGIIDLDAEGA